jgi:F-type H+-transporting ATPase subunit delta
VVSEKLARRYATAVFSLAKERAEIDAVGDDLETIAKALDGDATARAFFVAPIIDRTEKQRVVELAFGSKVNEVALHTVLLLVRKHREALLGALLVEYRKLQMAARGDEPLRITTARPLSAGELDAMTARLELLYRKKFEVTQIVDPNLIGGVRILMGDRRVDGSVSGRLEALARELFASN